MAAKSAYYTQQLFEVNFLEVELVEKISFKQQI